MRTPSTYNPVALAAAYSPSRTAWPIALLVTLTVVQQAHGQPSASRTAYPGYRPQINVPAEMTEPVNDEVPFEETRLAAMPVRSYHIKLKIRSIQKGQMNL